MCVFSLHYRYVTKKGKTEKRVCVTVQGVKRVCLLYTSSLLYIWSEHSRKTACFPLSSSLPNRSFLSLSLCAVCTLCACANVITTARQGTGRTSSESICANPDLSIAKRKEALCSNSSPAQTVNSSELMINMLRYIREQNIIFCADKNVLFFPERKIHYPHTGNKQNMLDIFQLFVISPVLFLALHYLARA